MLVALVLVSCSDGKRTEGDAVEEPDVADEDAAEPRTWTLDNGYVSVRVTGDPFGYEVMDDSGEVVLSSLGAGSGDGYGAIAWTGGELSWESLISPGYYGFSADLEPWRDDFVVTEVTQSEGQIELVLSGRSGEGPDVGVVMRADGYTLRIEASVAGGTPRAWAAAYSSGDGEGFLGFGERFNRANQRGVDVYCWCEEGGIGEGEGAEPGPGNPQPNGEAMTYYPVPFFLSTGRYAFWLDSTWRSTFNLATEEEDAWRVWHVGPTLALEIYAPDTDAPRGWPYQLLFAFTSSTAHPMIPPAWTFGPRRRINRNDMQGGVPEIQAMRDLDLAITGVDDALHFLPAGRHVGIETELGDWISSAETLGYRVNAYYNPYLSTASDSPLADLVTEGVENGYFLRDSTGNPSEVWMLSGGLVNVYMIDFTVPDAVEWYESMLGWAVDIGYSGWMYDFGEYVQPDAVADVGTTGEELHNIYPVLYQGVAYRFLEDGPLAGDWLTFARSGFTGASRYAPMVWAGDPAASFEEADGLPSMVRAGISAGISGIPHWGGDIGGFHCTADGSEAADEELLVRWIQQGSMSPNMQDQDSCLGGTGEKANIFDDPLAQQAWRTYARLHTRLFPYLYTYSHLASENGSPIMRHVFLEHPDRTDLADVDDAYYLGHAILVAPVLERGATTRTVDLPSGTYLDWQDEQVVAGGAPVTLDAPLAKLPLLLRDGHLVPMLDPTIDTLAEETHSDVVGPGDVSDVYDVVGLVTLATGQASFTLWDGGNLEVEWTGTFVPPSGFTEASDEAELSTCDGCYLVQDLGGGLARVRLSTTDASVIAGGLELTSSVTRRIRWDLYLVE